jgi:C4-dicarboxylate-specific signal transduction histidine kinase
MAQCDAATDQTPAGTMRLANDNTVDAVRYHVLRKLAAGMRHTLMGELQAIQFAADLTAQMVKRGVTGAQLSGSANQISDHTRSAVVASRSIMEWLRPDPSASAAVEVAVHECMKIVGEVWILRGIRATVRGDVGHTRVSKAIFLEMVVVSLLALTDVCPGSLDIDVVATQAGDNVVVKISATAADRMSAIPPVLQRALTYDDVRLMAETDGIRCACDDATISLEFRSVPA